MTENMDDLLNGGFHGLYGEVVDEDVYRMNLLEFTPSLIFDIGANVGIYTRFVKELFPDARVIALEPNEDNFANLVRLTDGEEITFIKSGIGHGTLYRHDGVPNGAHESYVSEGLGFTKEYIDSLELTKIPGIMLDALINKYRRPKDRIVVKVDCEGAENLIFDHESSMDALKQADYIVMELHWCSVPNDIHQQKLMMEKTLSALIGLSATHDCEFDHIYFYATKK